MYLLGTEYHDAFLTEINASKGPVMEENFKYAIQFYSLEKAKEFMNAVNKCYDTELVVVETSFKTVEK